MSANVAIDFLDRYAPLIADQFRPVNATTSQNQLYGAIDFSALSWLEKTWSSYYIWMGNPVLATGLLSFIVHEVSEDTAIVRRLRMLIHLAGD